MHVIPLFINLHWLTMAARIKFKALMFAYKTTTGSTPLYLNSLHQTYVPCRSLRSASERQRDLVIYWPLGWKNASPKAYISAIKSSDDQVTMNPVAINDIFKGFYTNLYKAETDFDEPICK